MSASRSSSGFRFLAGLQVALLLSLTSAVSASSNSNSKSNSFPKSHGAIRSEFIEAMQELEHEQHQEKAHRSLQEQLFRKARMVTKKDDTDEQDEAFASKDRKLSYAYGQNGHLYRYNIVNDGNERALNLTEYALKYVGCQNIHTWSDTRAENSDQDNDYSYKSPLTMEKFVVLRACERDSCSSYNKWGCNYNYAEYMLPMEDYLSIMATYHLQQFKQYCEVCYDCLNYNATTTATATTAASGYAASGYASNGDDAYAAAADDAYAAASSAYGSSSSAYSSSSNANPYSTDDGYSGYGAGGYYQQEANDDYYQDDTYDDDHGYNAGNNNQEATYPWYIDSDGETCLFESVCDNHKSACKSYSLKTKYYEDYFTCSEFTVGNDVGYLGPHCRSDGYTIGIGIFDDADCSGYIGDQVNIQQYTGKSFNDKELMAYVSKDCISCMASESYSLYTDDTLFGSQVYPVCAELYDTSAQCNKHLAGSDSDRYDSQEQADNEEAVCGFVASLVENNYDEKGEIYQYSVNLAEWQNYQQYIDMTRAVSPFQLFAILSSIGLCLGLFLYSWYLNHKLRVRAPWRPYTPGLAKPDDNHNNYVNASNISRINSGILMMRSRSPEPGSVQNI